MTDQTTLEELREYVSRRIAYLEDIDADTHELRQVERIISVDQSRNQPELAASHS